MLDLKLRSLDQDNEPFKLDNTYIESALFALFRIDLMNFITNKAALAKNFHIQPSEIDNMPMWEYEIFMKKINDIVKKENDEQEKEMGKHNINDYKKPKMPNYQQPKIPSISTPKF